MISLGESHGACVRSLGESRLRSQLRLLQGRLGAAVTIVPFAALQRPFAGTDLQPKLKKRQKRRLQAAVLDLGQGAARLFARDL